VIVSASYAEPTELMKMFSALPLSVWTLLIISVILITTVSLLNDKMICNTFITYLAISYFQIIIYFQIS